MTKHKATNTKPAIMKNTIPGEISTNSL